MIASAIFPKVSCPFSRSVSILLVNSCAVDSSMASTIFCTMKDTAAASEASSESFLPTEKPYILRILVKNSKRGSFQLR